MARSLSPEAWAQIRHDYEQTERTIPEICAEHRISDGTLRDRVRRWRWARRRPPIPAEGPLSLAPLRARVMPQVSWRAAPAGGVAACADAESHEPAPASSPSDDCSAPLVIDGGVADGGAADLPPPPDNATIVGRLQSAIARMLPAIETIVARLGPETAQPRAMEQAARALSSLTRTLRELNTLLTEHQARAAESDQQKAEEFRDIEDFRAKLMQRIMALRAEADAEAEAEAEANLTGDDEAAWLDEPAEAASPPFPLPHEQAE